MMDYQPLYETLLAEKADAWVKVLPQQLEKAFDVTKHGHLKEWQNLIEHLVPLSTNQRTLDANAIQIGLAHELSSSDAIAFKEQLKTLHPWRKGPYDLFGINIDTEWRSDWKWDRLKDHISPLKHEAKMVIGIDPFLLNVMQFQFIKKCYGTAPIYVLPLGIEDMPYGLKAFDTVFSMGVLYHRRSPLDHLMELRDCLKSNGELILETLVIDGALGDTLLPDDRYAMMRNVWFLPSCDTLISWLKRCGFKNIRLIDVTSTSLEEQRSTDWMQFHSLKDFLNPNNPQLTYEGLPAPKRAIIIANSP
jgi:tRNA (mo5U34)-methyltransferase